MHPTINSSIRDAFLYVIGQQSEANRYGGAMQQSSTLQAVSQKLGSSVSEEAILTQWHELFRTGLAWGHDLLNPDPPFFHLAENGQRALANATRDPSNPLGYLNHLRSVATLDAIAHSYLSEGLDCYVAGLYKSSAVMVGCAAESMILELRDTTVQKLTLLGKPTPSNMNDWRIKTVSDALQKFFDGQKANFGRELRESFDSYWAAFAAQIRTTRNDAGHPASVDPVTPESAHASLLVFPELARVVNRLTEWVSNDLV